MKDKITIILGPTAVGKTRFSIMIAKRINAEIINADSMQIYKYMNIGTAKPTLEEQNEVKHHLIDIINPDDYFNVKIFTELAVQKIEEIKNKKKYPIIVGGTGLYIKGLLYGIFDTPTRNIRIRKQLKEDIQKYGLEYVHNILNKIDPETAIRIHPNDEKRIIRALEIFKLTGKSFTELQKEQQLQFKPAYNYKLIGLTDDRKTVYNRIEDRCDDMIDKGFIEEVKSLREMGYKSTLQSMQAIGYSHINRYLEGELNYDEMIRLFKRDSRRYAKRQWTLFNSINNVMWIKVDWNKNVNFYIDELGIG